MMVSLSIAASIDFESSAVPPKIEVFSKPEGDDSESDVDADADADANFGGAEARRILERKLLAKLDLRMSILIVIYILNYVSFPLDSLLLVVSYVESQYWMLQIDRSNVS
jgi:hypothetical protein